MGFNIPKIMEDYLNSEGKMPFPSFINTSQFYAGLNSYYINYMVRVVRQCMAYSLASTDGSLNYGASCNIGYSVVNTASKLIKGDRVIFNGDDKACEFLSDIWSNKVGFDNFLSQAIIYTLCGGTCATKINIDRMGACRPTACRVDRYYADTDDNGDVTSASFFLNLLSSQKSPGGNSGYWLVEQRYYKNDRPVIIYKVHTKSGIAGQEVLPQVYDSGINERDLPTDVRKSLLRQGIKLNKELPLPFNDGLGVWLWTRTATNSCVPGVKMGDPLLYGALDILWALDMVFGGSIVDVIQGKGKILVPKRFLKTFSEDLKRLGVNTRYEFSKELSDDDDSLVYIYTEPDKDFKPEKIQFDIRAEQYKGIWELYLRQLAVHCGFAPTSLFPFLQDGSLKTATEVTAEENLTRATVMNFHSNVISEINRLVEEVLLLHKFKGKATVQLSDYIGNKIQRDANLRENYAAGGLPQEVFVQKINDLSVKETREYLFKIEEEQNKQNLNLDETETFLA